MKLLQRIAVFTIAGAMLTGCTASARHGASAADNSRTYTRTYVSLGSILADPTPELQGLYERPVDVYRNFAIVNNVNLRLLSNDLGRTFYTNHPSRLTPYPVMSLTGNPW